MRGREVGRSRRATPERGEEAGRVGQSKAERSSGSAARWGWAKATDRTCSACRKRKASCEHGSKRASKGRKSIDAVTRRYDRSSVEGQSGAARLGARLTSRHPRGRCREEKVHCRSSRNARQVESSLPDGTKTGNSASQRTGAVQATSQGDRRSDRLVSYGQGTRARALAAGLRVCAE